MTHHDKPTVADHALDLPIQIYEAKRFSRPRILSYLAGTWRRRKLIFHLARSDLRARHVDTVLGQLWNVLNPLLLAGIYFVIFGVIFDGARGNPDFLASLILLLFSFYFTRNSVTIGAGSVVGGGALLTNTTIPRLALPLAATTTAFLMYLPTFVVYAGFHIGTGKPLGPQLLAVPLIVLLHGLLNAGLSIISSVTTVFFRDATNFMPYLLRIGLYVSPVLYRIQDVPSGLQWVLWVNPLTPVLSSLREVVLDGSWPEPAMLAIATGWAVVALVLGLVFFLSKEHEFAIRA